jgi:hypothetical protein
MKNPPEFVQATLNTLSEAEIAADKWLQKVMARLAASRIATQKIGDTGAKKIEKRWGF